MLSTADTCDKGIDQEPKERNYIEVTFEYASPPLLAPIDQEVPNSEPHIAELQKQCEDFKDIFKYLQDRSLPDYDRYAKFIVNEANKYVLRDGTLYHLFQPRKKRRERCDLDRMILHWPYQALSGWMSGKPTMTAKPEAATFG